MAILIITSAASRDGVSFAEMERFFQVGDGSGRVLATWRNIERVPSASRMNAVIKAAQQRGWFMPSNDQLKDMSILPLVSIQKLLPSLPIPPFTKELLLVRELCLGNSAVAAARIFSVIDGAVWERGELKNKRSFLLNELRILGATDGCESAISELDRRYRLLREQNQIRLNGKPLLTDWEFEQYWLAVTTIAFDRLIAGQNDRGQQ